jgi:tRNA(Arg) A34 adenosine deaminase TadA
MANPLQGETSPAGDSWHQLALPWQVAFEEAWESWKAGSAGVGACIVDTHGAIVTRDRNRMSDDPGGAPLAGTRMAHAEMNALAGLGAGDFQGYAIYTTFEPCVMCASAIRIYRITQVHYATDDPVWVGLHDAFRQVPAMARRLPERERLGGPWGALAHVLHLAWLLQHAPAEVIDDHRTLRSRELALAEEVAGGGQLHAADTSTIVDAADLIWEDLLSLAL